VTLQLDDTSPNFEQKKKIFNKDQDFIKTFRITSNILDFQVIDFFSFLRFILYDGDVKNLMKIINDNQKLTFEDNSPSFFLISPIDKYNEIKLLNKILDIISCKLNNYKTTLQEDENLIKEAKLNINLRNCIIMRMSEKKILKFFLHFAQYCLDLYSMTEKV
jgi:hypothetical protein